MFYKNHKCFGGTKGSKRKERASRMRHGQGTLQRRTLRTMCSSWVMQHDKLHIHGSFNMVWVLHHDNAPSHASLRVREFLVKNNVATLPQPPYSSDMAPADFFFVSPAEIQPERTPRREL